MVVLYIAYRMLLSRDNQPGFNRTILLLIYLISFMLSPFLFSLAKTMGNAEPQVVVRFTGEVVADINLSVESRPNWGTLLIWIYLVGVFVVAAKTLVTWIRLMKVVSSGERIRLDGYTLVIIDNKKYAPFSWMRYVIISRNDYLNNYSLIAIHELKHVACHHWIDLLIAQIVCIINWFNPAAWLMRDELILVHEYQADMAVVERGFDAREYQMFLIKKSLGARFSTLANSLNHGRLSKRITMMCNKRSCVWGKVKAVALLPMIALAFGMAGIPSVRAAVSTINSSEVYLGASNAYSSKGDEQLSRIVSTPHYLKAANADNDEDIHVSVVAKRENIASKREVKKATSIQNDDFRSSAVEDSAKPDIPHLVAYVVERPSTDADTVMSVASKSSISIREHIDVYLDGEIISYSKLREISPDMIASMTIDRQKNALLIITK